MIATNGLLKPLYSNNFTIQNPKSKIQNGITADGLLSARFITEVGNAIARTNNKATKIINLEAGTTTPLPLPSHLLIGKQNC